MGQYICKNEDCSEFDILVNLPKITFSVQPDGTLASKQTICPICNRQREELKIEGDFSTISLGMYQGSNNEERRRTLKKRATADYKKNIKPWIPEIEKAQGGQDLTKKRK